MTASGTVSVTDARVRAAQRHTVGTLMASQSLGGLGLTIGIAVAALLAEDISGSASLSGLAGTTQVLGAAVASAVLARVMSRRGRRFGLASGYVVGAAGGATCVMAGVIGSFALLLVGATLLGSTTASNAQSRYAAIDLAPAASRASALSLVVWATTIGAVAGPNLTGLAGDLGAGLGLPRLTGPFLVGTVGMLLAGLVVVVRLRPDPLLLAREAGLAGLEVRNGTGAGTPWTRALAAGRGSRGVVAGVSALALAHASMVSVMIMTPLHMHHGGASLSVIGVVISLHVLGMFAFSPVVGWGTDRLGRPPMLSLGAAILLVSLLCAGTSPIGASPQIGLGLFLLGLGWSCCTVAASTLLSESAPAEVRTDVQGAADLVMGLVAAAAGALAGVVVGWLGYAVLTALTGLLVLGVAAAAELARRTARTGGLG